MKQNPTTLGQNGVGRNEVEVSKLPFRCGNDAMSEKSKNLDIKRQNRLTSDKFRVLWETLPSPSKVVPVETNPPWRRRSTFAAVRHEEQVSDC